MEYKNLIEIIELCKEELDNNNENVNATLDFEDLKELQELLNMITRENIDCTELNEAIDIVTKDIRGYVLDAYCETSCCMRKSNCAKNAEECPYMDAIDTVIGELNAALNLLDEYRDNFKCKKARKYSEQNNSCNK